jgi:hypothetical protein
MADAKRDASAIAGEPVGFAEEEEPFDMANLSSRLTGLPFVVWIWMKGGAQHDVRVKVSPGPRVHPSEFASVGIRPDVHVISGSVNARDVALLAKWVELNRDVLIRYWDGDLEYTEDALAALRPVGGA